ncbi:MAG: hypothetical protein CMJ49_08220 [Planctomycetaceae bacterium]|nr:hypothetical protein [Planctomycetaceae bacterium]
MTTSRTIDGNIYFTDLPALIVGDFRPAPGPGAGWISFDYELDTFGGVGLATGALSPAEPLALDLGLTGWHRLHVAHSPAIRMWLDGETGYTQVPGDPSTVRDYPFPAADYTGRKLHIAPAHGSDEANALTLFYLRAEPCDSPPSSHRNLVATDDGHGVFYSGMDTPRDISRHLYQFRDSDFFRVIWGPYGGGTLDLRHDSTHSDSAIQDDVHNYNPGEWKFNRALRRMVAAGVDPLTEVRRITREIDLELHFYFRVGAFYGPFPHMGWTRDFYARNPQWRCRDEFGDEVKRISYAHRAVQDHVLAYFEELMEYEADGLCLAFNRGLPLMVCEDPVLDAFKRKHGRPPRLPEEVDSPEMLDVRGELMDDFVARVQQLVESHGQVVSCIAPRDFERSRLYGLNLELLIERGRLESVMVGAGHGDDPPINTDLAPVQKLKALGTKIYSGGSTCPAHGAAWDPDDLIVRAKHMAAILDAGLDGGYFWDAESVIGYEWETMRRFGDRALLDRIIKGEWPPSSERDTLAIGGFVVDRYSPWNAY